MLEADGHLDALQALRWLLADEPDVPVPRGRLPSRSSPRPCRRSCGGGCGPRPGAASSGATRSRRRTSARRRWSLRAAVDMPLMLLGGINRLGTMQQAMADGFDFVVMGRALLREPDLVRRLQSGEASRGTCIHCNQCMPTIYSGTRCPEWAADEVIPIPLPSN
nr:hypothetical protein [Nocardioides convexus]